MAAALVQTPVDELAGMPLPLAPFSAENHYDASPQVDWHHHFHPRRSPVLVIGGGLAVRQARVQLANYTTHHFDYHDFYGGPSLPETDQAQFNTVVFAVAGYIPEEAISFHKKEPRIVGITSDQRALWWESGDIKVESLETIRRFMSEFVQDQSLDHISEQTLDEFRTTAVIDRNRYLGHLLLAKKIERATETVDFAYRLAWKKALIPGDLPAKASSFVQAILGSPLRRKKMIKEMKARLAS